MPQNDGGGIRRNGGVYFHRHTGLVPVSSQIACRPWRLIIALDSGMRRNDDGEFAGMTTGEFAGMTTREFAGMATGVCAGMATGVCAGMTAFR